LTAAGNQQETSTKTTASGSSFPPGSGKREASRRTNLTIVFPILIVFSNVIGAGDWQRMGCRRADAQERMWPAEMVAFARRT
jgi:hypothetical protein